ncbi:glycosyltransferase family 25 protein [Luteolibacter yonseiensis]|uniref:Glycosyltransferase family 25 protein n=1 Tax=Luteolibacter yonseiensis TaxID=1144680 RepID=A0A934V6J6_9BACT|nr:glycosyltransferase family 25 protein [Luteolibacter yonseiensis]MBK1815107.1 glycosyltransferase family 25 protein [Luteolibacter yonseiensis]
MKLKDYFERIFVINLPYKEERRARLTSHLAELGLAEPEDITWVRAVSGEKCPAPAYFQAGNGAWGCLHSHLRIVQDAIMDGLGNYLVLEDDVVFHEDSMRCLARFWEELPADWGQIYLGGQHLHDPEEVDGRPFVLRARNINRTHAFALRNVAFQAFQKHITHAPDYMRDNWHIDHQLGAAHERMDWNVYVPAWWVAGQEEGTSNISGRVTPRHWWNHHRHGGELPFIYLDEPPATEGERDRLMRQLHFGYNRKPDSVEDVGLDDCVGSPDALRRWLGMIAAEAIRHWMLPAIWHPSISIEEVRRLWDPGVLRLGEADIDVLLRYPGNGLFEHPLNSEGGVRRRRRVSAA